MDTGEHPWNVKNTTIMLTQILRASFTVPPYVSASCKELHTKTVQADPSKLIPMAEILKHPRLRCAESEGESDGRNRCGRAGPAASATGEARR
jgi:hypothetical protein